MRFSKYLVGLASAIALVACGGGGGSAGTPSGGSAVTPPTSAASAPVTAGIAPTLTVGLSGGGSSITASGSTVVATVKDASGALVTGKLVTFSGDQTLVKFSPASGQVLTVGGTASIQVSPTSFSSAGNHLFIVSQ